MRYGTLFLFCTDVLELFTVWICTHSYIKVQQGTISILILPLLFIFSTTHSCPSSQQDQLSSVSLHPFMFQFREALLYYISSLPRLNCLNKPDCEETAWDQSTLSGFAAHLSHRSLSDEKVLKL